MEGRHPNGLSGQRLIKYDWVNNAMERTRIARLLRIAVTAVSLTACVLLVALWVRSYWRCDIFEGDYPPSYLIVGSVRGYLGIGWEGDPLADATSLVWEFDSYPPDYDEELPSLITLGFEYKRSAIGASLLIPYWFPVIVTGLLAVALIIRRPKRFSLRTLLIATTLVAVAMGIFAVSS